MRKTFGVGIAIALACLVLSSCGEGGTLQTPSNMAIRLSASMQIGDVAEIERLMCTAIAAPVDLDDPISLGPLRPIYEAANSRTPYGGASEYTPGDSLDIPVDNAWTEVDFVGLTELDREVWRFHMVRENGVWKVCSVEPRPDAPLPPADVGTVDAAVLGNLVALEAASPEDVRRILLETHTSTDANARCAIDGPSGTVWSVIGTGLWPVRQSNGGYLIAYVEATANLAQWRAYTIKDCAVRLTHP